VRQRLQCFGVSTYSKRRDMSWCRLGKSDRVYPTANQGRIRKVRRSGLPWRLRLNLAYTVLPSPASALLFNSSETSRFSLLLFPYHQQHVKVRSIRDFILLHTLLNTLPKDDIICDRRVRPELHACFSNGACAMRFNSYIF
jgi:hypothetical protein